MCITESKQLCFALSLSVVGLVTSYCSTSAVLALQRRRPAHAALTTPTPCMASTMVSNPCAHVHCARSRELQ